jgi:peptide/nickel transport system permease protein
MRDLIERWPPSLRYTLRRLGITCITLAGISLLSFATVYWLPGDPVATRYPQADAQEITRRRIEMGLDQPFLIQYVSYMRGLLVNHDLGWSLNTGAPVTTDLVSRLPASLELATFGILLALLVAVPLGILAAVYRNRPVDHLARLLSIGSLSLPAFWVGIVSIFIFFHVLRWAPAPIGQLPLDVKPPAPRTGFLVVDAALAGNWTAFAASWKSLALPTVVFALAVMGPLARITRAGMVEALEEDFVTFARAVGVPDQDLVLHDALRGAMVGLLTTIGITVGVCIAGQALVETVFSWPGIGNYVLRAVATKDMAPLTAILLILAVAVACINFAVDLLHALIDPRIRHSVLG